MAVRPSVGGGLREERGQMRSMRGCQAKEVAAAAHSKWPNFREYFVRSDAAEKELDFSWPESQLGEPEIGRCAATVQQPRQIS